MQILFLLILTDIAMCFASGILGQPVPCVIFAGLSVFGAILFATTALRVRRSRKTIEIAIEALFGDAEEEDVA